MVDRSKPEYNLLRDIVLSGKNMPPEPDERVVKVARALWKHWWPTLEPQDREDYAAWWRIAFADAKVAVEALTEEDQDK